ncbi:hypothetical protein ACFLU6_01510 [Acidobacteriota bacterium]
MAVSAAEQVVERSAVGSHDLNPVFSELVEDQFVPRTVLGQEAGNGRAGEEEHRGGIALGS